MCPIYWSLHTHSEIIDYLVLIYLFTSESVSETQNVTVTI